MKRQVFIVWFIIFLVWAIYRAYFNLPESIDELVIKPLVFVLPVLAIVFIREKKKLSDLHVFPSRKDFFLDLYIGVIIGILFAFEGLAVNYLKYGQFSFSPLFSVKADGGIIGFFIINLFTSLWEEILGRGYLYQRLYRLSANQMQSALISSFLFLLLHIPIMFTRLQLTGMSLLIYPVSILILGVTNCYLLTARKSLTLPILIHTFWNMTVALYL